MLVGEVFARMGLDSKQYEKGLGKLEGMTQKKAVTLGGIFKGAFSFALGMGLVSGFKSLGGALTNFVNTASRTEVLGVALQSVARSSGYAMSAIDQQKKAVMDLGVAEQEATQILTRFMQAQLDAADASKISRVAQDAAVLAGTNSSDAALTMTEAIAKLRPELLANYGMTRNLNDIYADYAKTAGKTATQLTETEKKQAMLNYILAEGDKIAGTYEASMGAVGKQIGSLPRYWDTLKNAIAAPLALPAISVIVDGLTNGLKNAIGWAEANKMMLQSMGQSAANVAGYIVSGFQYVTRTFAENWGMIRFAATALITYAVATRTAAGATALLQTATVLLNGNMAAQAGLLGFVSNVVTYYKVQMLGAAATSNIFTAALMRVRAALIAVNTALGPVGWAVLAITGLVTAGMALWNRYSQSLQKTASTGMGDFRKAEEGVAQGAGDSSKALDDQTKALNKAGKAAQKNLQPFDEINQMQKESASGGGAGSGLLDGLNFGDVGGIGGGIPGLGDMLADMEAAKPTLKGFWEWIKSGVGKLWDKVKQAAAKGWDNVKKNMSEAWQIVVDDAARVWGNIVKFFSDTWGKIADGARLGWDNVKKNISNTWNDLKNDASRIWGSIVTFFSSTWQTIRSNAALGWSNVKLGITSAWNDLKADASRIWESVKGIFSNTWTNIKNTAVNAWNGLKTKASNIWENIKNTISNQISNIKKLFNFKWSLPKIKLPHFSVSWSTAGFWGKVGDFLGLPGRPSIGVNWYAKGGIFNQPSVIGVGEAGREAVLPLDSNTGWADIVADRLASAMQGSGGTGGGDIYVYIGNEQVDAYVHKSNDRRNVRSNGR